MSSYEGKVDMFNVRRNIKCRAGSAEHALSQIQATLTMARQHQVELSAKLAESGTRTRALKRRLRPT